MDLEELKNIEGTDEFPNNTNDVYDLVETIAVQNIRALKSTNRIVDGVYEYDIENGKVIEEAVIEMAEAQAFDKTKADFSPKDPVVHPKYFSNFDPVQFKTTIRRDDIRAIIANKGVGVEDVVSQIMDTLSQGEGNDDFIKTRELIFGADFKNYREILGGVPASMKGVIYALRDMYNHLKANNSDLTSAEYISATPSEDIRIALTPKVLNLIDVIELANTFNLSKEELFGKLVVVDCDDIDEADWYKVCVYDRKALGRATRIYDYTQDIIGSARYSNHYLTVERAYFHNGLFKGAYIDCTEACVDAKADVVAEPTSYSITKTLTQVTTDSTVASVVLNEQYKADFACNEGYTLDDDSAVATVTMGGEALTDAIVVKADGSGATVSIPRVTGNVVITITAVNEE